MSYFACDEGEISASLEQAQSHKQCYFATEELETIKFCIYSVTSSKEWVRS